MTQLAPTNIDHNQILARLKELRSGYELGLIKPGHQLDAEINGLINDFFSRIGIPTVEWDPVVIGEPPNSTKANYFFGRVANDIGYIQENMDIVNATTVFTHNLIKTELLKARAQNSQLNNKLKTLQLYTSKQDANVIIFGDYFKSKDFTEAAQSTTVDSTVEGQISLLKIQNNNLIAGAKISILETSNGFAGNNQEILPPQDAEVNPVTKEIEYTFYAEQERNADLQSVKDKNPLTWFEYEHYLVFPADIAKAKGFNFSYKDDRSSSESGEVIWANGPPGDELILNLEVDLTSVKSINNISFAGFGLVGNRNNPILIKNVSVSPNGTDWTTIGQENVWVGNNTSLQSLRSAENISLDAGNWSFSPIDVRYIRFQISQPNPIDANIGHLYYQEKDTYKGGEGPAPGTQTKIAMLVPGKRVEGPIPRLSNPGEFYRSSRVDYGEFVQKKEYFSGKRWAIGVRDLEVSDIAYSEVGYYVSKPFRIGGVVDRVAIESDFILPESFDSSGNWVRFYISPNDGLNWFPISPIQDDYRGIPEIVVFNDPIPASFREQNAGYHNVNNTVDSLRVKIELRRPTTSKSSTPIINNYRLKVRRR